MGGKCLKFCDKFLQFCMMLHRTTRYSKTTANKVDWPPWWPVCTTLKIAATGNWKYHISAPASTILSCNTTFYMFSGVCEDSISEIFSLYGGHLHGLNLFPMSFIVKT